MCDQFPASRHWSGISEEIYLTGNSGDYYTCYLCVKRCTSDV